MGEAYLQDGIAKQFHGTNLHVRFFVQWFVCHGRNQKRPRNHAVKFTVPIYKKPNF